MTTIEVAPQVAQFVCELAPEPRRAIRLAIKGLSEQCGDIKALRDELEGFFRLRVGGYRVIFHYEKSVEAPRIIRCDFAERRAVVYDSFEEEIRKHGRKES